MRLEAAGERPQVHRRPDGEQVNRPEAVALRPRHRLDELVDAPQRLRIAVHHVQEDGVHQHAQDGAGRRIGQHVGPVCLPCRLRVARGDGEHLVRAQVQRRGQRRREPNAAVAVPAFPDGGVVDVDGGEEERQRR